MSKNEYLPSHKNIVPFIEDQFKSHLENKLKNDGRDIAIGAIYGALMILKESFVPKEDIKTLISSLILLQQKYAKKYSQITEEVNPHFLLLDSVFTEAIKDLQSR